jgi:chaperonin GroES
MSLVSSARRLVPLLDRVLVEKVVPPTVSAGGILLPETTTKVNHHCHLPFARLL